MEMEMASHGSVRIMKRQSQHKTTGQPLWHVHLSARSELHSQPLAEHAQVCGRITTAEGLEGPIAPVVTTGGHSVKKTFSHVILALWTMLTFSAPTKIELNVLLLYQEPCWKFFASKKTPRVVRVFLAQGSCNPSNQ